MMQPSHRPARGPLHHLNVGFLIVCALLLVVAGIMMVDLVAHQQAFGTPHYVGSSLLDYDPGPCSRSSLCADGKRRVGRAERSLTTGSSRLWWDFATMCHGAARPTLHLLYSTTPPGRRLFALAAAGNS